MQFLKIRVSDCLRKTQCFCAGFHKSSLLLIQNGCLDHQISQRLLLHEENKEVLGHLTASPTRPPVRRRRRDTLHPFLCLGDFRIVHGFSLRAGRSQIQKVDLMRNLRPIPPVYSVIASTRRLLSLETVSEDVKPRYRIISMVSPTVAERRSDWNRARATVLCLYCI